MAEYSIAGTRDDSSALKEAGSAGNSSSVTCLHVADERSSPFGLQHVIGYLTCSVLLLPTARVTCHLSLLSFVRHGSILVLGNCHASCVYQSVSMVHSDSICSPQYT